MKCCKKAKIFMALFFTGSICLEAGAQATDESIAEKVKKLSAEQAVDFDSNVNAKTSISQKMVLFELSKEYECPLFSNSPYTEMLDSLDNMQDQLNTVFPRCQNKALTDKLTQKSVALRNNVFDAKKLIETGQTYKLEAKAKLMIDSAQQIQQTLATAAQAQTEVCYQSNQQFRNTVFAMNETFQGIAPIVMDIVTKNPGLAASLGPAIKVLSGAQNLSNGLSLIEQIAKDSVVFDMTDKNNRMNTLKNVCQYMKLYKRLEYMRLSKLGQIQTIFSEYQAKIKDLDENLQKFKTIHNVKTEPSGEASSSFVDEVYEAFVKLKTILPNEVNRIQKAQIDIENAQAEFQNPLISQCIVIKAALNTNLQKRTAEIALIFANGGYVNGDEVVSLANQIKAYQTQFDAEQGSLSACVSIGQDILKLSARLVDETQKIVSEYDRDLAELKGDPSKLKEKKAEMKQKTKVNAESDLANLKSLLTYAAFESSEVEKRAKDMHKYFFKGPDVVRSECSSRSKDKSCGIMDSIAGGLKAMYQESRNQGPVYELLLNDRLHFNYAYEAMVKARAILATYESQIAFKEFGGQLPRGAEKYQAYMKKSIEYQMQLPHIKLQNVQQGSVLHKNLCVNMRQVLDKYLIASTILLGSQSLCKMIDPVLKEENISSKLKKYCIGSMKNYMTEGEPSEVQKMVYKLVGVKSDKRNVSDVNREQMAILPFGNSVNPASVVTFEKSPKALVDRLVKIYDNFECQEK